MAVVQNLNNKELEKLSVDKLEKEVSEAIKCVLEMNRGVLVSQKLAAYRECTILISKYNQQWKKQGDSMNENNSALVMNMYKNVSEELNKLTK